MKILFIGGTGIISSSCSQLCIEKGYELYLLNRGKNFRTPPAEAKIIQADINDVDSVRAKLAKEKFDAVVNWIAFNKEDVKRDFESFRDKTEQYIFISTATVYEKPPGRLPFTEDTPLGNPFWEYSQNKIACENFLMNAFLEQKFPVTICRPSHTYDKTKSILRGGYVPFYRMSKGKKIILHDSGTSLWTLTHTKDFAKGFIGLIGNPKTYGEAYHITSDETLTWKQIAEILANKTGYEIEPAYIPTKFIAERDREWGAELLGDKAYDTVFDNSKIKSIVPEFKAEIPFEKGAGEIVEWYSKPENQILNYEIDSMMDKIIDEYEAANR
ncbi:MAG: SDR family oxidoreductase [Ignavibacteriales bacterium]|nr:SDR family oxidoreductase [Ignavibacteriales bacterium]